MENKIAFTVFGKVEPYKRKNLKIPFEIDFWLTDWRTFNCHCVHGIETPRVIILLIIGGGYEDGIGRKTMLNEEEKNTVDCINSFCEKAGIELFLEKKKTFNFDGKFYDCWLARDWIINQTDRLIDQLRMRHLETYGREF